MRGKTAKRLRRLALRQMFIGHLTERVPMPESAAEADYQFKRMSKALKRLWKQGSKPRSLAWVDDKKASLLGSPSLKRMKGLRELTFSKLPALSNTTAP